MSSGLVDTKLAHVQDRRVGAVASPSTGAHLLAAASMLLGQRGMMFPGVEGSPFVKVYKQALERAQMQLEPATFEAAWAEGQQMTLEQALALATEFESEERT